jgi:hypothetical protein
MGQADRLAGRSKPPDEHGPLGHSDEVCVAVTTVVVTVGLPASNNAVFLDAEQ